MEQFPSYPSQQPKDMPKGYYGRFHYFSLFENVIVALIRSDNSISAFLLGVVIVFAVIVVVLLLLLLFRNSYHNPSVPGLTHTGSGN